MFITVILIASYLEYQVRADFYDFCEIFFGDARTVLQGLRSAHVTLVVSDRLKNLLEQSLRNIPFASLRIINDRETAAIDLHGQTIVIVALDKWDLVLLNEANKKCVDAKVSFIGLAPYNEIEFLIGPLVVPGQTACFKCMELRLESNWLGLAEREKAYRDYLNHRPEKGTFISRSITHVYRIACDILILETLKFLSGIFLDNVGKVILIRPTSPMSKIIPILKLPRCPVCSAARTVPVTRIWTRGSRL